MHDLSFVDVQIQLMSFRKLCGMQLRWIQLLDKPKSPISQRYCYILKYQCDVCLIS